MSYYVAKAYRWGWTNNGSYHVTSGMFLDEVSEAAEEECESRGGKYGVAVYKYPCEALAAYYPSSYDETEPTHNARIALFDRVGQAVLMAIEDDGKEAPLWLAELIAHEKECNEAICGKQC